MRYDYDAFKAFKAIDDWNYNYVDFSNLKRFLKSAGSVPSNKDLTAILRRLDLSADNRLTLNEFVEGIKSMEPYSKVTKKAPLLSSHSLYLSPGGRSGKKKKKRPMSARTRKIGKSTKKKRKGKKSSMNFSHYTPSKRTAGYINNLHESFH